MHYEEIHNKFLKYFKDTTVRERLYKRNPSDERLTKEYIYSENHHIIPRSIGGSDESWNIINVLPEEHLFLHLLRYKIFNNRVDFLALRYILNSFNNDQFKIENINNSINKQMRRTYTYMKQNSAEFRKMHGWQTPDGIRRISEARKDTIVMKEASTGIIVGTYDRNHPKYLNGEWVHHSKGKVPVLDKYTGENLYIDSEIYQKNKERYTRRGSDNSGKNNSRYIDADTLEIFKEYEKFCIYIGFIMDYSILCKLYKDGLYASDIPIIGMTDYRISILGGLPQMLMKEKYTDLKFLCKKAYSNEERRIFLEGFKNPREFLFEKFKNKGK